MTTLHNLYHILYLSAVLYPLYLSTVSSFLFLYVLYIEYIITYILESPHAAKHLSWHNIKQKKRKPYSAFFFYLLNLFVGTACKFFGKFFNGLFSVFRILSNCLLFFKLCFSQIFQVCFFRIVLALFSLKSCCLCEIP